MEDVFNYDERHQANFDSGFLYYLYKYDKDHYHDYLYADIDARDAMSEKYCVEHLTKEFDVALTGVIEMINDGVLKSPAYFAWEDTPFVGTTGNLEFPLELDNWIGLIRDPQKQVDLINYLIESLDIVYKHDFNKKSIKTHLKALLAKPKNAVKERKRQEAEERAKKKSTQQKPEYYLTLDEIVSYVQNEPAEVAPVIKNMFLHFLLEKPNWNKAHIKNVVNLLTQKPATHIHIENNEGIVNAN